MSQDFVWQIGQLAANTPPPPWQVYAPVAFDIMDAVVEALLQPHESAPIVVRREVLTMGSVRYLLRCEELGSLGELRLRKLRDELTELYLERPPGGDEAHEVRAQLQPRRLALQRHVLATFLRRYHAELLRLEEQVGLAGAGRPRAEEQPPNPRQGGWDEVFAWFYRCGVRQRMTVDELAAKIGYAPSTVRHRKAEYDAEHGTSLRKKRQI